VVLAGNSIGGFTVLSTAAKYPELVKGLVLLNVAGKFADKDEKAPVVSGSDITKELEDADVDDLAPAQQEPEGMMEWLTAPVKQAAQRGMLMFAFYQARLPMRIKSVLQQVYIDKTNVDDYLVNSISQPAYGPNAAEVYYRLVTQVMLGPGATTVDRLLSRLKIPLLLLWGDLDPWMGPSKAARIQELYPKTDRVSLQSGHCPHDESPAEANKALLDWMAKLE
jgi:pimeloyl-ACP methyl ester carboxylesterase